MTVNPNPPALRAFPRGLARSGGVAAMMGQTVWEPTLGLPQELDHLNLLETHRQLGKGRRQRLVELATRLLRVGDPPSLFRWHGTLIFAIRSSLLLSGGWLWRDADIAAKGVVLQALRALGAKRPSWAEASTSTYAQGDAFSLIEHTRCRRCGGGLSPENRVFCSRRCLNAYHSALHDAAAAAWRATVEEGLGL